MNNLEQMLGSASKINTKPLHLQDLLKKTSRSKQEHCFHGHLGSGNLSPKIH